MSAFSVKNTKIHLDYSDKHIKLATVKNTKVTERPTTAPQFKYIMLSFTILRSPKTHRCYIYNKDYLKLAQCDTMNDVFDFFYCWCDKLSCKSVIYTQTDDKNVIRVMMD